MVNKRTPGEKLFDTFNVAFLVVFSLICIYPMLYVLYSSVSEPSLLMRHRGLLLFPQGFQLKGYKLVLENGDITTGFLNTVFYVVSGTALSLFMSSIGAYVLSRRNLYFGKLIMFVITITMFFSGGLIPYYLLIKNLGMIDHRIAVIVPGCLSVWNLIIMRTSFLEIPAGLEESAKIDGANDFKILFKIILPMSKAVLAVIGLFAAVGHWNSWFNAMIFFRRRELFPLQLILREILISNDISKMMDKGMNVSKSYVDQSYLSLIKYATTIVATVPILVVYPFLQKYFVKGVMIGSLKG